MHKLRIRLLPLGISVLFIIIIGTMFYSLYEGWNYIDSLYFTIMTLTTVGYGDMYPTNNVTKIFTIGYVLIGVYLIFYSVRIFTMHYMELKSPNISRAISKSFEHLADRTPKEGDVVLKVKPVKNPEKIIKEEIKKKQDKKI
jgi:voltage-gated potassium channel